MEIRKITYNGSSKVIKRICEVINEIIDNGGGGGGTYDYTELDNLPKINGVTLTGNKSTSDLDLPTKTSDLTNDSNFVSDASYVHTDNNYTNTEKTKLAGLDNYVLPPADTNTLGGIKVGDNLSVEQDGTLNALSAGMSSVSSVLLASNWSGNTAPYTYDLGNEYIGKDIVVGYDASSLSSSIEAMNAAAFARIIGGESTLLYAYGLKPTVNIPIVIIYG